MRMLLAIGLCSFATALLCAQQPSVSLASRPRTFKSITPESALDRGADIRVDTVLVQIPVNVTEPTGRIFTGLDKENFKLTEDKVDQEILGISGEDEPISVGIVFDTSGSMGNKLQRSREAVKEFLHTSNGADEFFVVQFNDHAKLTLPFTYDTDEVQTQLGFAESKGQTALLDAVYLAMNQMKRAHNPRKAILIISDGGDNSSRYTEREVRNAVTEADVQIYAIGIFERILGRTLEEMGGPGLLKQITELTGGRHFAVANLVDLPDVAAKIGLELRNQYILSYNPRNPSRDGKYRKVEVRLVNLQGLPPLKPRYRTGYYAPPQ